MMTDEHEPLPPAVGFPLDRRVMRLLRKLEKRDLRIAGLQRRVAALESALATKDVEAKRLPREVARAVQEALCNVRMIPVIGAGKNARIVEVKSSDA
jgi:hypothetical protein